MIPCPNRAVFRRSSERWSSSTSAIDASKTRSIIVWSPSRSSSISARRRRVADPGVALALAQPAPSLVEQLLVGPVALDVARRDAELLEVRLGARVVEPLAERGAVVERHPEVGVGHPVAKAAPLELELADHEVVEQADDVGAGADHVALVGERALERAGAARAARGARARGPIVRRAPGRRPP